MVPFTFGMDPVVAVLLLVSVYMAGEYGGSITAIAIGTPGTPAAAATMLDGYELTKQGKPGLALTTSVVASSIGGMIGVIVLFAFSEPLARVALSFGAPEYFLPGRIWFDHHRQPVQRQLAQRLSDHVPGSVPEGHRSGRLYRRGKVYFLVSISSRTASVLSPPLIGLFAMASVFLRRRGRSAQNRASITFLCYAPAAEVVRHVEGLPARFSAGFYHRGPARKAGATITSFICYNEVRAFLP